MTPNRRNYYRILQVQPEAPPEVIKASWRALMHAGRGHPDLGGDPATAALINEAYAVLGDAERRRDYDRQLDLGRMRGRIAADAPAVPAPRVDPARWRTDRCCPMCRTALPAAMRVDARCTCCDAPLTPAPEAAAGERELVGRRAAARRARSDSAALISDCRGVPIDARLVDLSLGGAGLFAAAAVSPGTAVRIVTGSIDAVGRVVACHRSQAQWRVRVQWLTARPLAGKGVWVRVAA
ncbi:MAG: J domain-containing protein [Burkholderiales bacterium]|nr:MAG: J domain-containing protein [Burkholderiales bacterium]